VFKKPQSFTCGVARANENHSRLETAHPGLAYSTDPARRQAIFL